MNNKTDIVERLRNEANASEELNPGDSDIATMREAADVIERLRGAITREWCLKMASIEDGSEIGAGPMAVDPIIEPGKDAP